MQGSSFVALGFNILPPLPRLRSSRAAPHPTPELRDVYNLTICETLRPFSSGEVHQLPLANHSSLIGCTSCIVKSFRSRSSFISSPLWTNQVYSHKFNKDSPLQTEELIRLEWYATPGQGHMHESQKQVSI